MDVFTTLEFTLVNPVENSECTYTHVLLGGQKLEDGKAFITRKDGVILSGTFSGTRIKEGRFDVSYTEANNDGGGIAY